MRNRARSFNSAAVLCLAATAALLASGAAAGAPGHPVDDGQLQEPAAKACGFDWWTEPAPGGLLPDGYLVHVHNPCAAGKTIGISLFGLDPCSKADANGWADFKLRQNGVHRDTLYIGC